MDGDIKDMLNNPTKDTTPDESVKAVKDPSLGGTLKAIACILYYLYTLYDL